MNENSEEFKLNDNYYHKYNIIPSNINYGTMAETNVINGDNNTCFNKKISYSILIVAFCVLISDMSRGILFPTLWLNIQSLNGNKSDIGFAVASFSLGRIISSPIFGVLSVKYGYRYILILCNSIMAIGAFLYISSTSINNIIFAQFIMGFSAGSLGVSRSYIAESSLRVENRTIYLANLTAVQYFAFTCTPLLGILLYYFINIIYYKYIHYLII
jgi:ceroid-lipofuscinosis MFS transporter 7